MKSEDIVACFVFGVVVAGVVAVVVLAPFTRLEYSKEHKLAPKLDGAHGYSFPNPSVDYSNAHFSSGDLRVDGTVAIGGMTYVESRHTVFEGPVEFHGLVTLCDGAEFDYMPAFARPITDEEFSAWGKGWWQ